MNKEKNYSISTLFDTASKHPYLAVTCLCLLLFPIGLCEQQYINILSLIYAGIVCSVLSAMIIFLGKLRPDRKERITLFVVFEAVICASVIQINMLGNPIILILWLPLAAIACLVFLLYKANALSSRNFIIMMIVAGIILRFAYVLYTSSTLRQHDMGTFASYTGTTSNTGGHSHYITYWYLNGLKLPDFNVSTVWQFYQPPLHHWLMALLLRILTTFGIRFEIACEAIQILPMLYSSLVLIVCYKIFRKVKLSGVPLIVAMAIICFHPTFVIMGGFYNNDLLSLLFVLFAVDRTLVWYRTPTMRNIIPIAFCVGLGMMSKLSGWMVAPSIALIFLIVFIKGIDKLWKYIGQFAVFGLISIPLGLWWQVRNLIKFSMPITWVPKLSESFYQYQGNRSVLQRLFDFGNGQLEYVYDAITGLGAPYNEYNPTVGLLKSSIFAEGSAKSISNVNFPQINIIGPVFFWAALALFTVMFISFIVSLISRKTDMDIPTRLFFGLFAAVLFISYYLFCFEFPFTCTQNIRYCSPLIPLCAMGLGLALKNSKNKIFHYSSYALVVIFAVLSTVMFTLVGS